MREVTVRLRVACGVTVPVAYTGEFTFRYINQEWGVAAVVVESAVVWTHRKQGDELHTVELVTAQRWTEIIEEADSIVMLRGNREITVAGVDDLSEMLDRELERSHEHDPGDEADRWYDRLTIGG